MFLQKIAFYKQDHKTHNPTKIGINHNIPKPINIKTIGSLQ